MAHPIKLHALRIPEVGLRANPHALILSKMDFMLWGWNWTSKAMVRSGITMGCRSRRAIEAIPIHGKFEIGRRTAEVLVVSSNTEEDTVALEEVAAKTVEDVGEAECGPHKMASPQTSSATVILEKGEDPSAEESQSQAPSAANMLCVQVLPLLQYLDRKREKYAEASTTESYVEIIRNRKRIKVAAAAEVAAKERKSHPTEARYQTLQKRLAEEVEKQRYSEKVYEGLREDVERTKCATVDLLKRLEACRTAYDAESLRVDELTATAEKEQEYETELGVKAKKLAEYEAGRN
ncbi:hypothetical protein AXG93_1502s1020 [Marchantia polymorpha subsp. ruderalis]|uniref:Uncharacterized protein n=1 Tax=Marchantia polymorpha subsp. ruderalis TaxID=1480154 RepID=A0A176WF82_MARPO|nr:hypothetical protein AXG93_1502s1020 [Marchantia polymorpha subsp. ruderalis]